MLWEYLRNFLPRTIPVFDHSTCVWKNYDEGEKLTKLVKNHKIGTTAPCQRSEQQPSRPGSCRSQAPARKSSRVETGIVCYAACKQVLPLVAAWRRP